jgi:hypothetical protein
MFIYSLCELVYILSCGEEGDDGDGGEREEDKL